GVDGHPGPGDVGQGTSALPKSVAHVDGARYGRELRLAHRYHEEGELRHVGERRAWPREVPVGEADGLLVPPERGPRRDPRGRRPRPARDLAFPSTTPSRPAV